MSNPASSSVLTLWCSRFSVQLGKVGLKSGSDDTPGQVSSLGVVSVLHKAKHIDKPSTSIVAKHQTWDMTKGKQTLQIHCMSTTVRGCTAQNMCHSLAANKPEDAEKLVDFGIAMEKGPARDHFGEDAANRPQINGRRITRRAEQHFRCPIPQRHHLNHKPATSWTLSHYFIKYIVQAKIRKIIIIAYNTYQTLTSVHFIIYLMSVNSDRNAECPG